LPIAINRDKVGDKFLARPISRCIQFGCEKSSFGANFYIYIYI